MGTIVLDTMMSEMHDINCLRDYERHYPPEETTEHIKPLLRQTGVTLGRSDNGGYYVYPGFSEGLWRLL